MKLHSGDDTAKNRIRPILFKCTMLGIAFTIAALAALPSVALSPADIFERASRISVVVEGLDTDGKTVAQGSGVLIRKDMVVTNCHVVRKSGKSVVTHGSRVFAGRAQTGNRVRDICILSVPGLGNTSVKSVESDRVRVGQKAYAIGAPMGFDLTISEGLVSSMRLMDFGRIIQTSAPISPGSSGGGLFDEDGNLIGITTFQLVNGQNLNFALPVEWITAVLAEDLAERRREVTLAKFRSMSKRFREVKDWDSLLALATAEQKKANEPEVSYAVGEAHFHLGNLDGAARTLEPLASRSLVNLFHEPIVESWLLLSMVYRQTGLVESEVRVLGRLVEQFPNCEFCPNMWSAVSPQKRFDLAKPWFQRATEMHPNSAQTWAYLGSTKLLLDDNQGAAAASRQAVELDIENRMAWYCLLLSLTNLNEQKEVDRLANYLETRSPDTYRSVIDQFKSP